jgi:archaellum component FlaG (FlaF/FlaG flagellin family)
VGVITVGTTPIILVGRDPYRLSINLENRSTTAVVYIDNKPPDGLTLTNASIRILPNESCQILKEEDGDTVNDEWSIISDTAGTSVAVFEGYKVGPVEVMRRGP